MEHLPPVGWADVATKRDLDHLAIELRGEMNLLGTELRGEMAVGFAGVRTEIALLGGELYKAIGELHKEIGGLRGQVPTLFIGLVGLQITAASTAVALSRLL